MNASIRTTASGTLRAECGKCGRFLIEVHSNTNAIAKCPSCKSDNTIKVWYSSPNGSAVRSKKETGAVQSKDM